MRLAEFIRELSVPLRSVPVVLSAFMLLVIIGLLAAASIVNPWVAAALTLVFALALLPGLTRYLVQIAEWRARGQQIEPPSAEMFALLGSFWSLSVLLILVAYLACWYWLDRELGSVWSGVSVAVFLILYPAMVAVLVITHSFVQACNPQALLRLVVNTGGAYWYAPLMAFAVFGLPVYIAAYSAPLAVIAVVYLLFAFFAVTGAVLRKPRLVDEVDIPDPIEPDAEHQIANLERQRTAVLNHAYGFLSRGNRDGGLKHVYDWLNRDPNPSEGWQWFFEQMLRWEVSEHALYFAQRYIGDLLASGQQIAAVKIILRSRMVNEQFRPLTDDLPAAIDAAESCGNEALAQALRGS
ncbi:MAG: hypothetical protein OER97_02520 [Gammaproteobacteria bacterium]|nr:hypothetical protein [Gammaproteobacteria bacterium]